MKLMNVACDRASTSNRVDTDEKRFIKDPNSPECIVVKKKNGKIVKDIGED